jgi:protein subunit release factor B
MWRLGIREDDLEEKFVIGSGAGGQHLQKTSSCVYLKHLPSGLEVKCQKSRLREQNRRLARELLCDMIERRLAAERQKRQSEAAKRRRAARKRSPAVKEELLATKRYRTQKKTLRKKPSLDS